MKRILIAIAVFLLVFLPNLSWATSTFESYTETADMGLTGVHESITIIVNTTGQSDIEFLLLPDIENLKVALNDEAIVCSTKAEVGLTKISCDFGKQMVGKYFLSLEFDSAYPIIKLDNRLMFKTSYRPPFETKKFILILKLPVGYGISDPTLYVTPSADRIYSDGQRHILLWQRADLKEVFDTSVIAEPVIKPADYTMLIFIVIVISIAIVYLWHRQRKKVFHKLVYPHLIESEKAVVDALEANLGVLKQKEIQKITSFSKAKLSRVLKNLEQRGIIEKKPLGNTYKVFLIKKTKKVKKPEQGQ